MKPIFRPIQSQDDAPLAAIIRKSLTDHQLAVPGTAYFDPELDHLSEFYAADPATRHYFVVTDESGTLLGGGGLAAYDSEGKIAELQKFYLSDAAKGQRLSYPLLAKIEAKAFELDYRQLYLESHHSLEAALHVYQKAGYRALSQPLLAAQHTTMDRFYVKTLEPQQPNQCNSTQGLDGANGKTIE